MFFLAKPFGLFLQILIVVVFKEVICHDGLWGNCGFMVCRFCGYLCVDIALTVGTLRLGVLVLCGDSRGSQTGTIEPITKQRNHQTTKPLSVLYLVYLLYTTLISIASGLLGPPASLAVDSEVSGVTLLRIDVELYVV